IYLFAQNRVQKYLGAVAVRPRAGFGRDIMGGGPNPALTWVVTAPNQPPRYVIGVWVSQFSNFAKPASNWFKKRCSGRSWQNSRDEHQNIEPCKSSAQSSVRSSAKALPQALPKAL